MRITGSAEEENGIKKTHPSPNGLFWKWPPCFRELVALLAQGQGPMHAFPPDFDPFGELVPRRRICPQIPARRMLAQLDDVLYEDVREAVRPVLHRERSWTERKIVKRISGYIYIHSR